MVYRCFFIGLLLLSITNILFAQDTIYAKTQVYTNVKIRDNKPAFVEFRMNDGTKNNVFVKKQEINSICRPGGFHEIIIHNNVDSLYAIYYIVDEIGDTTYFNPFYDPTNISVIDTNVKLCRFVGEVDYVSCYISQPHFYINDPEKKFLNAKELTNEGVDFSCMKLVNTKEISKAPFIKNKHLAQVAKDLNGPMLYYPFNIRPKKISDDIQFSENSYKRLDSISWITTTDYSLPAGKIPAIIGRLKFTKQQGIGLIFIIEKFVKYPFTVSGYWVAFDFADHKPLLIDYIEYRPTNTHSAMGWAAYWGLGLINAGVFKPLSFQKYLDMEKKKNTAIECN